MAKMQTMSKMHVNYEHAFFLEKIYYTNTLPIKTAPYMTQKWSFQEGFTDLYKKTFCVDLNNMHALEAVVIH